MVSEPLFGQGEHGPPVDPRPAPPSVARSVMVLVASSPAMFALDATAGLKVGVASATGLSVIRPAASAPQAWLPGGLANAGAPPATRAPPISASDPAAVTAAVIMRFIVFPLFPVQFVRRWRSRAGPVRYPYSQR